MECRCILQMDTRERQFEWVQRCFITDPKNTHFSCTCMCVRVLWNASKRNDKFGSQS